MNLNHFYHYYKSKSGGVSNLLKASEDFTSSLDWLKKPDTDAPTITGDVTDPNGGTDAQRVNFTANRQSRVQQSVTLSASTQYTFSVYARVNTGTDQFRLRNVTLGEAEAKTATTSWTRFEYTFTTQTGGVYELSIQNTENVAANIEFFGAMLNVGASANDYVKVDPSTGGSAPTPAYSGFGDVFGGVTAYYSLRQFTEAETLNAIRVRRSSDDTEQDIGFDSNGDLDTTALLAFVGTGGTDNGFVTTWYDQSGNGNNATNSTESEQPLVVSGGTLVEENGKAALDFDGVDDYLAKIATLTINGDHMISAVHTPQGVGGYLFSMGYNDPESVMFWVDSTNYSRYWVNASGDQLNSGESVAGQRLTTGEFVSGTQTLYIDGTQNSTKSTTYSGGNVPDITIGYAVQRAQGSNYLIGKVQELIFFNSDQSSNRTGMETNINDHFDIYP